MSTAELEALVTPHLLKWARERWNYSIETIATKINVNSDVVEAWEREEGEVRPTFHQAQILAKKLHIPFGYLFLSKPPEDDLPLPDLRTIKNKDLLQPSPNFIDILYDAFRKQEWYHDYLEEDDYPPLPFVGKYDLEDEPKAIAVDIANTLGIDDGLRETCTDWKQFLSELIRRSEKAHILVMRSGIVGSNTYRLLDVQEFRGFAISDNLAPLIFINDNDYKTAQIFTLVHELAHLWIASSGISNPDYRSKAQSNIIDQFCNRVAAEVLVPIEDFIVRWGAFISLQRNLEKLARHYKVSTFVILRRAYDSDMVNSQQFEQLYDELLKKITPKRKDGGGHYYKSVLSRNSSTLTRSLMSAASEGRALPTEISGLLNIKVSQLNKLELFIAFGELSHA